MNCNHILQYYRFYCIFNKRNAALASIGGFFQTHLKILPISYWTVVYIYTHTVYTAVQHGSGNVFKCVWKKPLMLVYIFNWCATTKLWMYNWVLPTQEMLVVKQVLGFAKTSACPSQRAESRSHFLHIGKCHAVFVSNRSRLECWVVWWWNGKKKKKNIKMYLRGSMPVMPLRPSQKPYWVYTYRESNFISFNFHTSEDTRRLTRTYMRCKQTAAQASVVTERNGILDSVQESYWHACMCTDYSTVQYTKGDFWETLQCNITLIYRTKKSYWKSL